MTKIDESLNFCFGMCKITKTQRLEKIEELLRSYIESYGYAYAQGGMFPNKTQAKKEVRARKNLVAAIDTLMRAQK